MTSFFPIIYHLTILLEHQSLASGISGSKGLSKSLDEAMGFTHSRAERTTEVQMAVLLAPGLKDWKVDLGLEERKVSLFYKLFKLRSVFCVFGVLITNSLLDLSQGISTPL